MSRLRATILTGDPLKEGSIARGDIDEFVKFHAQCGIEVEVYNDKIVLIDKKPHSNGCPLK